MAWNYRVVVKRGKARNRCDEYAIHECYYDKDGNPEHITEEPSYAFGESLAELSRDYTNMRRAFGLPVLEYSFFEAKGEGVKK